MSTTTTSLLAAAIVVVTVGFFTFDQMFDKNASESVSISCQDCKLIARSTSAKLSIAAKQAEDATPIGSRRRLNMPLSEETVLDALDTACDTFTNLDQHTNCQKVLTPRRAEIEDSLFRMTEEFDARLCVDILNVCDPHEIAGAGEL